MLIVKNKIIVVVTYQNMLHLLVLVLRIFNAKENKKVLLREHKRHTDRGVSSTPSVTRGGVSSPQQGSLPARSDEGVPKVWYPLAGVPPGQV